MSDIEVKIDGTGSATIYRGGAPLGQISRFHVPGNLGEIQSATVLSDSEIAVVMSTGTTAVFSTDGTFLRSS